MPRHSTGGRLGFCGRVSTGSSETVRRSVCHWGWKNCRAKPIAQQANQNNMFQSMSVSICLWRSFAVCPQKNSLSSGNDPKILYPHAAIPQPPPCLRMSLATSHGRLQRACRIAPTPDSVLSPAKRRGLLSKHYLIMIKLG